IEIHTTSTTTSTSSSSLTDITIESQDIELHLNSSYSLFPQNEVHFTNTIADSQDFGEISSPIVKLPKSHFLTCAATNSSVIETHTDNSLLSDLISEPQYTELQLDVFSSNFPQNEIQLTTVDSQDFEKISSPIVKLPKTRFPTCAITNSSAIETCISNSFLNSETKMNDFFPTS